MSIKPVVLKFLLLLFSEINKLRVKRTGFFTLIDNIQFNDFYVICQSPVPLKMHKS